MTEIDLTGVGEHRPDHRRGLLVLAHLPDAVQRAEDATAYADYENRHYRASVTRTRPATPTERALLRHIGYTVPDDLTTVVEWLSNGVRRRTWPTLEEQNP
ncbi:hypothetical protein LTT02_21880 [Mycolicibacterium smegmatis]|uniref:hypothetical protein n=1 Tax=Mycolicibacterium smegmatis TaxID=1772 RepID=UPI0005D8836A|nr:hypothetical protein [Mycolicibacterium smegmatis]MDF1899715.1 hypothetical protein [Mycolicibacterium smegmatis]MDF1905503.1 hypothetical protein [Mycolicibacterium smegmatis]MDF1917898.1 hypothetical protein [Mycolicibacterium smegmatis]MDF1924546.1 hypothetical protein [Mycolicibacterium smegmatis]UAK57722.1 hypothetical protein K8P01_13910 [Mycolicibacterium smegmatis]